jgi:hypothetical protein
MAGLSPAEHTSLSWTHNRTDGFPVYGFPIIFFQKRSRVESKEPWLVLRIGPRIQNNNCSDTSYIQNYDSDVSDAGILESCRPDSLSKLTGTAERDKNKKIGKLSGVI